jgi:hypothetical protein
MNPFLTACPHALQNRSRRTCGGTSVRSRFILSIACSDLEMRAYDNVLTGADALVRPSRATYHFHPPPLRRRAVRKRSKQVFGLLWLEVQLRRRRFAIRLQPGTHGMLGHQSVQFVHRGAMNCASMFPSHDLLSQSYTQPPRSFHRALSPGRLSPTFLQIRRVARTKYAGCSKPTQERHEIRE